MQQRGKVREKIFESDSVGVSNIDSFLEAIKPYLRPRTMSGVLSYPLAELWSLFDLPYGLEVPIRFEGRVTKAHFVPYLSAIVLQASVCDKRFPAWKIPNQPPISTTLPEVFEGPTISFVKHNMMSYSFTEFLKPHERVSVVERVQQLAKEFPFLMDGTSDMVKNSSWFSIAWVPILSHIPTVAALRGHFLTYHLFTPTCVYPPHLGQHHPVNSCLGGVQSNPDFLSMLTVLGRASHLEEQELLRALTRLGLDVFEGEERATSPSASTVTEASISATTSATPAGGGGASSVATANSTVPEAPSSESSSSSPTESASSTPAATLSPLKVSDVNAPAFVPASVAARASSPPPGIDADEFYALRQQQQQLLPQVVPETKVVSYQDGSGSDKEGDHGGDAPVAATPPPTSSTATPSSTGTPSTTAGSSTSSTSLRVHPVEPCLCLQPVGLVPVRIRPDVWFASIEGRRGNRRGTSGNLREYHGPLHLIRQAHRLVQEAEQETHHVFSHSDFDYCLRTCSEIGDFLTSFNKQEQENVHQQLQMQQQMYLQQYMHLQQHMAHPYLGFGSGGANVGPAGPQPRMPPHSGAGGGGGGGGGGGRRGLPPYSGTGSGHHQQQQLVSLPLQGGGGAAHPSSGRNGGSNSNSGSGSSRGGSRSRHAGGKRRQQQQQQQQQQQRGPV